MMERRPWRARGLENSSSANSDRRGRSAIPPLSDAHGLLVFVVPGDLEAQAGAILDIARVALEVPVELVSAAAAERVDGSLSPNPLSRLEV